MGSRLQVILDFGGIVDIVIVFVVLFGIAGAMISPISQMMLVIALIAGVLLWLSQRFTAALVGITFLVLIYLYLSAQLLFMQSLPGFVPGTTTYAVVWIGAAFVATIVFPLLGYGACLLLSIAETWR